MLPRQMEEPVDESNDTKMSGNEAFLAFLSKNEGGDEDDDE